MGLSILDGSCKAAHARKPLFTSMHVSGNKCSQQKATAWEWMRREKEERGWGLETKEEVWWLCSASRSVLAPELAWPGQVFCRAQQQRVLTEEMVPAPHLALLPGAAWRVGREGREQQRRWIPCLVDSQQGCAAVTRRDREGHWKLSVCT